MNKALVVLALMVTATISAADVAGTWRFKFSWPDLSVENGGLCTFQLDGSKVSGYCSDEKGEQRVPLTGTSEGDRIEWQMAADEHVTAAFSGTLEESGTSMSGTMTAGQYQGRFTAARTN